MIRAAGRATALGLLALAALCCAVGCEGDPADPGPAPLRGEICQRTVQVTHRGVPALIGVSGSFNGFDARRAPLTRIDTSDQWQTTLTLPPGVHRYRVEVDGRPLLDPAAPVSVRHQGETWSRVVVPDCAQPAFELVERTHAGAPVYTLALQRVAATDGLDGDTVQVTVDGAPLAAHVDGDRVVIRTAELPRGKHHLRLIAQDTAGRASAPFEGPFWVEPTLFRWQDAIIYQVFTDRFAPATHDFTPGERLQAIGARHGGHLDGVRRKLREGYFDAMGVNTLWISPMNLNPDGVWTGVEGGEPRYESYHAYWPIAARSLDPRFGTAETLDALIAEAHAKGMRVLLDVVLNHVHAEHPYYTEHPEWFTAPGCYCGKPDCSWAARIETCWFTAYLPDLSWQHAEALEAQVDDALWWVERFDFDGLRVDAVPMMPRFVTRALTERLHARFEALGTRHLLVGETFTGPEEWARIRWYLGPDGLDGQFDFPLMWALRAAFAWESSPLWALADAWRSSEAAWAGSTAVMGNFIGNHDVSRFLSEAAGQLDGSRDQAWDSPPPRPDAPLPYRRHRLALAAAMTLPGAAVIYQGDEYGEPGANDPDNRRPMRFGADRTVEEQAVFTHAARLGRLRACLPALRRGELYPLREARERWAYLRDAGDGAPAIVVLNRAPEDEAVELGLPPGLALDATALVDVLSGRRIAVEGERLARFTLAPRTAAVLVPADHPCATAPGGAP